MNKNVRINRPNKQLNMCSAMLNGHVDSVLVMELMITPQASTYHELLFKTRLVPPLIIGLPVPSQEGERSCIYVLGEPILSLFLRFWK